MAEIEKKCATTIISSQIELKAGIKEDDQYEKVLEYLKIIKVYEVSVL
jgi:hypothetical protein